MAMWHETETVSQQTWDERGRRIAELEAKLKAISDEIAAVGLMLAYHEPGKPTLAIRPGQYELLKKTFGL